MIRAAALLSLLATLAAIPAVAQDTPKTVAEAIAAAGPADWRTLDPEQTVYLELATGRVVIALAPAFAPQHAANIKALAREGYFDGLFIVRVQDNYVTQWGDPEEEGRTPKPIRTAKPALPPEFFVKDGMGLPFAPLPDADVYAPQVGFSNGFPAARDPATGEAWLAHCYGTVGVGRDGPETGSGAGLYAVIGHGPRHLDRNITVVGRVVQGMELLSALPRGTGRLGFYETAAERIPLKGMAVAADLPEDQRTALQTLRTDTAAWTAYVEARRNRREDWFVEPAGRADLCNVPVPVRPVPAS